MDTGLRPSPPDGAATIPDDDAYFLDTIHFTLLGMRFLAEKFAHSVAKILMTKAGVRDRVESDMTT